MLCTPSPGRATAPGKVCAYASVPDTRTVPVGRPELQPLQVGLAAFNGLYSTKPAYIQAGAMMTIAVPVILFICFQRTFVRGIMSTGVEK
ncbi:hypothetical protein P3X83_18520 [Spongiactinospora sp. TRM90649]|nr:hypothetical protein [Spongiactinospora sp. TRM90649]